MLGLGRGTTSLLMLAVSLLRRLWRGFGDGGSQPATVLVCLYCLGDQECAFDLERFGQLGSPEGVNGLEQLVSA